MGATYPIALLLHSWLRWAVLIGLVLVVIRSWTGRRTGVWSALDERIHGAVVGIDTFGESAPASAVFKYFGFTVDNVVAAVRRAIGGQQGAPAQGSTSSRATVST